MSDEGTDNSIDSRRWDELSADEVDQRLLHDALCAYHLERGLRSGEYPGGAWDIRSVDGADLGPEIIRPDLNMDLPALRALIISEWGVDPDHVDPPEDTYLYPPDNPDSP